MNKSPKEGYRLVKSGFVRRGDYIKCLTGRYELDKWQKANGLIGKNVNGEDGPWTWITCRRMNKPIQLTLTRQEAKTLAYVCSLVGGDPRHTRGYFDSILRKLSPFRKQYLEAKVNLQTAPNASDIYFKP